MLLLVKECNEFGRGYIMAGMQDRLLVGHCKGAASRQAHHRQAAVDAARHQQVPSRVRGAAHRRLAELDPNCWRRRRLPALPAAALHALGATPAGRSGLPLPLLLLCLVAQGIAACLWRVGKVEEQQGVVAAGGHAVAAAVGRPRGLTVQGCMHRAGWGGVGV